MLTEYTGKKIAYEGQTYNATANTVTGTAISGNPINWYNGTAYTNLTWKNGRKLASLQKGSSTYTYAYGMNGIRSSKTVNGVKHNYITQNGKIVREEYGTTVLEFVYDTNGAPYALRYSTNSGASWLTYYYILNLQGDVVKLIYADGTVRAEYTYDAWGEILSATNPSSSTVNIQDINPLRYRGYYYDAETGWYYLQSRYYDPVVKRFINADGYVSTGQGFIGHNMFAYCNNNPACLNDDSGTLCTHSTMVADTGGRSSIAKPTPKKVVYSVTGTEWTSYGYKFSSKGDLYENWYNDDRIIWTRHHSTHGNSKYHTNPHDHAWGYDEDGHWTQGPGQPVNPEFQPPDEPQNSSDSNDDFADKAMDIAAGAALGYVIYGGAKWLVASWLAPVTGGGSLVVAGMTP